MMFLYISPRTNVENQILKSGFTSREIIIIENDDPGGVFEFTELSKGPWIINVRLKLTCTYTYTHFTLSDYILYVFCIIF